MTCVQLLTGFYFWTVLD